MSGLIKATAKDIARFMSKVDKLPNGCWYWMGARSKGRGKRWYGSFSIGNTVVRAHRFSSEVLNGDECPKGSHRDHLCVFSMCVAPHHIEVVSAEENIKRKCPDYRAQATGRPPPMKVSRG